MTTTIRSFTLLAGLLLAGCTSSHSSRRGTEASLVGIAAQTDGVVAMLYPDGGHVSAGDVVAVLDPLRIELRLEDANAELERAERADDPSRILFAKAAVAQAKRDLNNTSIRTPIAGVVSSRALHVGQPVGAGSVIVAIVPARSL
jgi:multidrug resistance efflux pump